MYKGLEKNLKEEVKNSILLFKNIKNHKKLKVHKLRGVLKNAYSFSVNYRVRIVFKYEDEHTVNLLYVGSHDEVYD
ncbi:MAG: type II toxin-antitoxin system RelE/ParE family toxin [Patescibacteria group bacterium]